MLEELQGDLKALGITPTDSISIPQANTTPSFMNALGALDALCQWREVEVDLPLLKTKVLMKPIKGIEELRLKSIKANGETFIRAFNEILFSHADFQGKVKFKDIDDFMAHLSAADKSMMTFGLLFATYPELGEREFVCPHCETKQIHNIRPDELLHEDSIVSAWDKKGLFTDFMEELEIVPGFIIKIGFQTELDSLKLLSIMDNKEIKQNVEEYNDIFDTLKIFIMFIKEISVQSGNEIFILKDTKEEIYPFIMGLNNIQLLKKLISRITEYDGFTKYQPKFYAKKFCTNVSCGKEFKWMVNPEIEFFRETSDLYSL
jgi:hypothetical protein